MSSCRTSRTMLGSLLLILLFFNGAAAVAVSPAASTAAPSSWLTLSGNAPAVIARGGFSGMFPESSEYAYQFALSTSLHDVVLFCDLQLTKDGVGICKADLRLDNSTNIADIYPKQDKTYIVNGESIYGYFSVDYTSDQLFSNVTLIQSNLNRPDVFDGQMPMMTTDDVRGLKPPRLWLNVQHDIFFKEHNLDIGAFILQTSGPKGFDFISSPEIGFLKGLKIDTRKTKLVFKFREQTDVEPSTNETYGSLLKDLANIQSFASGILVPKSYIWPVTAANYLTAPTTLVTDAHKLGLEVYVSNFANDVTSSYNYSYDPTAEYLQFIDNSDFAVDGVLTDFPTTASEAVACLAHNKNNTILREGRPLIITHNGASGIYAGCTDLAYQKSVEDGADFLDCAVQMSKDGVPFCLPSVDIVFDTTATSVFQSRITSVPEIQQGQGIFSFDLTWSEIQSLKPQINSPFGQAGLYRNPAAVNEGKYLTLPEFLDFAKNSTVSGIYIDVENAPYLASTKGFGIVDVVLSALKNASYDKQTTQEVFIQSDDSAVLSFFKKNSSYKRILMIREPTSDTPKPTVNEIKEIADAVAIPKSSIFIYSGFFTSSFTNVVDEMHAANISVYVFVQRNEYSTIALDFFSDPMVEIATLYIENQVDGIITEFPGTITSYFRSPCSDPNTKLPFTILPAVPGSLVGLAPAELLPPVQPPAAVLEAADVIDPPLPPVIDLDIKSPPAPEPTGSHSGQPATAIISSALCILSVMLSIISLSCH